MAAYGKDILSESPLPHDGGNGGLWGSDAIAAMIRRLDIPYLAINPGASFRGLHDSLVNHLGNTQPQLLLCLHEESAVAIAHGYAKATDSMMGVVLHSNVGLMHGLMGIFNAWCDRQPIFVLGATGPWDAARRRPWIDWIHTVSDQGGMVRDFTKWDNQPASVDAAWEALLRARQMALTAPRGPTYVNLDMSLQEDPVAEMPPLPDPSRFVPPFPAGPDPRALARAAKLLGEARRPVILAGRVSRSKAAWDARIALAEKLQADVWTDLKSGAAFPTGHPLHAGPTGTFLATEIPPELREADVILSLDWNDLAGLLNQIGDPVVGTAKIVQVSVDVYNHRGWCSDHQGLPPVDVGLLCEPDAVVPALIEAVAPRPKRAIVRRPAAVQRLPAGEDGVLTTRDVADALNAVAKREDLCLVRLPLAWRGEFRDFAHPLDYLGYDGGGGIGSGPGMTVGAALGLKGSARTAVGILGDGDFLMGVTALWTAVHYSIPCLLVVCNNRSFFNDEMHQEKMALLRSRPTQNRWIGQRIEGPDIDIAMLARAQGAEGIGPVSAYDALRDALAEGLAKVQDGAVVVIDARVD